MHTDSQHPVACRLASLAGLVSTDIFIILTATLAAFQLIPLLEGSSSNCRPGAKPKGGSSGAGSSVVVEASGGSSARGGSSSSLPPPLRALVVGYWRRRARRILPAYLLTNLLLLLVGLSPAKGLSSDALAARNFNFRTCPRGMLPNLLFVSNLGMRVGHTCGKGAAHSLTQALGASCLVLDAAKGRGGTFDIVWGWLHRWQ